MNPYIYPGIDGRNKYKTIEDIISVVCYCFNASREDIFSKTNKREKTEPRRMIYWLCWKYNVMSITKCAQFLGQNHTTGLYHIKTFNNLLETDKTFKNQVFQYL